MWTDFEFFFFINSLIMVLENPMYFPSIHQWSPYFKDRGSERQKAVMLFRDSKSNSGLVHWNQYKSYCVYLWGFIAKSNLNIVINLWRFLKTTIRKLVDLFQNNLYNTAYNNYSDYVLQDFMSMVCSMY